MDKSHQREQAVRLLSEQNRLRKLKLEADSGRELTQKEENTLFLLGPHLDEIDQQIERIRAIMRAEEERIQRNTAEAMRRNMDWKRQQWPGDYPGFRDDGGLKVMAAFVVALLLMGMMVSLLSWLQ